jgi:hypothetical protein
MPKYDTDQEKYQTTSIDDFTLTFVLDNGERGHSIRNEAVSAFLQLTAENTQTIIDLTYQTCVVKPKFFRADPSDETLRWTAIIYPLVIEGINFDFVNLYSEQFKDIFWYSSSEEYAPIFEESLRDLDEWFKLTQK